MTRRLRARATTWPSGIALSVALAACQGQTSLDAAPSTGASTGEPSAQSDTSTTDTGADEPAVALCEEGCNPLLLSTWEYEGQSGTLSVLDVVEGAEDSIVLGVQRVDGEVGLVQLTAQGEPILEVAPGLPCNDCQLEDIAVLPSGDVIISATSPAPIWVENGPVPDDFTPGAAILARFDVLGRRLAWTQSYPLIQGEQTIPRAGELAVLDDDRIVQMVVDGNSSGERLTVRDHHQDGTVRLTDLVRQQPGSGDGHSPLAARSPTGELVVSHPWRDPDEELSAVAATWRLIPPQYQTVSEIELPLALDDLAVDSLGRRVELAHSRASQSMTLLLTDRRSSDPERWSTSLPIVTTSEARASLAIGPDDDIYVAARATPRLDPDDPYVVMLEVARWSSAGQLRWQARRPLDIMATTDPVELLVDDDEGLVVGTVVLGRLHVVRYEQACACG